MDNFSSTSGRLPPRDGYPAQFINESRKAVPGREEIPPCHMCSAPFCGNGILRSPNSPKSPKIRGAKVHKIRYLAFWLCFGNRLRDSQMTGLRAYVRGQAKNKIADFVFLGPVSLTPEGVDPKPRRQGVIMCSPSPAVLCKHQFFPPPS